MTTTINAVASTGLVQTSDGSGIIKVQSNGVATNALAWVNFNGTTSPGTIRAQYNVSSVTKVGSGQYTVNFTNALADANYCAAVNCDYDGVGGAINAKNFSTTSCTVQNVLFNLSGYSDHSLNNVTIFGN